MYLQSNFYKKMISRNFCVKTVTHSVEITKIYSYTFLAKIPSKQRSQKKVLNRWFDEIFFEWE